MPFVVVVVVVAVAAAEVAVATEVSVDAEPLSVAVTVLLPDALLSPADVLLSEPDAALPVTSVRSLLKSGVPRPVTGSQPVVALKPFVLQPGLSPAHCHQLSCSHWKRTRITYRW